MARTLPVAIVQESPIPVTDSVSRFAGEVQALLARFPQTRLVAYPELHLFGVGSEAELRAAGEPLSGPRVKALAELAGDLGIWLLPGSLCEVDDSAPGAVFNTAVAFSPEGRLAASYRKIFPWRPYEIFRPGGQFVVFDVPDVGRLGFSICYDAWFPEVSRQLAWMGAEVIINPVQTTTSDRAQELVLARANAIVNQVFVVSVNAAAPVGVGRSLVVDPEGRVRVEADDPTATVLTDVLDLDEVTRVRQYGTAGLNRMWDQFTDADAPLELPLYQGRIDPARWKPREQEAPQD
ncbi:MAG TPA: carbon-nitrogen hydrolase family protein [Pseudonocardia sp.]|jgi:predicted amidohydrolase|nr:carbon-nitrogen hydrolase family protein [Pseudonocardia sp.]